MSELRLVWDASRGRADIALVAGGQPDLSEALETWIIVSLFTDRLAEPSDPVIAAADGTIDRRGWWGDSYLALDHPGDRIGSRLWLLERSKSWTGLPQIARGYCLEALQWLIDDGIASAVEVKCFFANGDTSRLVALVTVTHISGQPFDYRYDNAWTELALAA